MYNPGQELSSLAFDKIIGGALDAVVKAQNESSLTTVNFIKSVGFTKGDGGSREQPVYVDFKYPKEISPYQPEQRSVRIKIVREGTNYDAAKTAFYLGSQKIDVDVEIVGGAIKSATLLKPEQVEREGNQTKLTIKCPGKTGEEAAKDAEAVLEVAVKPAVEANIQQMLLQIPLLTMMPIPFIRIASTDIEFNVKINTVNITTASEESKSDISSNTTVGYKSWWSPVQANTSFNASFASQKKNSSSEEIKKEFSLNIKVHAVQDEMPAGVSKVLDILEESIVSQPAEKSIAG